MPDLRQLRAFVAVAEELNFSRAAERLHLGQQAVSKSVQQLERELGVELLERTTREVGLTAAGAALLDSGRPLLADADAAFRHAQEVGGAVGGRVEIGVSPALTATERQELVRALRGGAPELVVNVREVRPREVADWLRGREIDLMVSRTTASDPALDSAALRPTPAQLCVPADHRLAETDQATLAELDGERLLVWNPPGTPFTDLLLTRLSAAGVSVELVESRVLGAGAMSELPATGAVALVPHGQAPEPGTAMVALADDLTLPLVVQWPAGATPAAVRRVREAMAGEG